MSNLRTICRPHTVFFSSFVCCRERARVRVSFRNPNYKPRFSSPSSFAPWFESLGSNGTEPWFRVSQRRTLVRASNWSDQKSPYDTLGNSLSFFFLLIFFFKGSVEEIIKRKAFLFILFIHIFA
jgi:hypothetical protein